MRSQGCVDARGATARRNDMPLRLFSFSKNKRIIEGFGNLRRRNINKSHKHLNKSN